jgi:hypothetical protein
MHGEHQQTLLRLGFDQDAFEAGERPVDNPCTVPLFQVGKREHALLRRRDLHERPYFFVRNDR